MVEEEEVEDKEEEDSFWKYLGLHNHEAQFYASRHLYIIIDCR